MESQRPGGILFSRRRRNHHHSSKHSYDHCTNLFISIPYLFLTSSSSILKCNSLQCILFLPVYLLPISSQVFKGGMAPVNCPGALHQMLQQMRCCEREPQRKHKNKPKKRGTFEENRIFMRDFCFHTRFISLHFPRGKASAFCSIVEFESPCPFFQANSSQHASPTNAER